MFLTEPSFEILCFFFFFFQSGEPGGLVCDRFAGNIFEDAMTMRLFVDKFMSITSEVGASVFFHEHRFAVIKVRQKIYSAFVELHKFAINLSLRTKTAFAL